MKKLLFILAFFCLGTSFAQTNYKIDTSNYYDFLNPKNLKGSILTTGWLSLNDVVPIMIEELKQAGYDLVYDRTIYKLKNGQHINISAYSRKSNIGFLYIGGHSAFPRKSHRDILFQRDNSKVNYIECEETFSGVADIIKINEIPNNIFVLKEDCYFFQYTDNSKDNKVLVTKEIAAGIFRQDLRRYLLTAPKPEL